MKKLIYVITIPLLLFLLIIGLYVNFSASNKGVIKLKETYLKVVDEKYIGKLNIDTYKNNFNIGCYGFTKNSVIISKANGGEYAVLPLKNIKELDKKNQNDDIFASGANPNVSSIIPCEDCCFTQYQDKLMMIDKSSCKSDNNSQSKVQLSFLDDNGYINTDTIKNVSCTGEYIYNKLYDEGVIKAKPLANNYSYNAEIYYLYYLLYEQNRDGCRFLITSDDKVLLEDEYNSCIGLYTLPLNKGGLPFSMSQDITKFAMVDKKHNKIRLYTFDNKSIKTNVLTDIVAKSDKTALFLLDNGYLNVIRYDSNVATSKLYKINDFTKPDEYTYAGDNIKFNFLNNYIKNIYHKIEDDTAYKILIEDYMMLYNNFVVSHDMKMALKSKCEHNSELNQDECYIYLLDLEPTDANKTTR